MTAIAETTATEIPYDIYVTGQAREVLAGATALAGARSVHGAVQAAIADLGASLEHYRGLCDRTIPAWFPGTPGGAEGSARAVRTAAEDAWEAAGALLQAIGDLVGPESAADVAGENGGEQ